MFPNEVLHPFGVGVGIIAQYPADGFPDEKLFFVGKFENGSRQQFGIGFTPVAKVGKK